MEKTTKMKCYKKPELEIICTDVQCQAQVLSGDHIQTVSGGDFDETESLGILFSVSESSSVKSGYENVSW